MTESQEEKEVVESLLIPRDQYLAAGIHIGTQIKTREMQPFIYRITRAGLYVIDIRATDIRMRIAAKFISRFDPEKIVVVSARRYGHNPIQQFASVLGAHALPGRFIPGTLTNPNARSFRECDLLIITDPRADRQALKEAKIAKIPVVSFCDTDNNLANIDLCVPANNRGRKALALIFWLLTRSVLLEKGEIVRPEEFNVDVASFQSRGKISFEISGDRAKILEQLGAPKEEEEEEKIEKQVEEELKEELEQKEIPAEEVKEEKKPTKRARKEKPVIEEEVKEEPKPTEKVKEEAPVIEEEVIEKEIPKPLDEGEPTKTDEMIKGPLPIEEPKKEDKKSKKKKSKE